MPNMKNSWICSANYFDVWPNIFTIQHNVLITPSMRVEFIFINLVTCRLVQKLPNAILIKSSNFQKVRSILTRHPITKITPKTSITWNHKLIGFRWHCLALECVNYVWIIKTKNHRIINLRQNGKFIRRRCMETEVYISNNSLYDLVLYSNDNDPGILH